jgi:hypothetical protein
MFIVPEKTGSRIYKYKINSAVEILELLLENKRK